MRILDERACIDRLLEAEAIAVRAGAIGCIEREVARLQVVDRVAMDGAREGKRVLQELFRHVLGVFPVGKQEHANLAGGELRRLLDGLGDAAKGVLADHDAVDNDLDRVLDLLVEHDLFGELMHLAVDADAGEAFLRKVLEELLVLALAAKDDRREHERTPSLPGCQHLVCDLVRRLALDDTSALGAVRHADAGIEQAQVVIDLRDGADGRARVLRRRLLVDGDSRREAFDRVHIGLVHLAQELPGIAREALDVAPLAFCIDCVEGKRRLAGAREAGDHDKLVAGNRHIDVLQIVLPGTANDDGI